MNAKQIFLVEKLFKKSFSDKHIADILGVTASDIAECRKKNGMLRKDDVCMLQPSQKNIEMEPQTKEYSRKWYVRQLGEIKDTIERIENTLFEITDYEKYMQMSNHLSLLLRRKSFIENLIKDDQGLGIAERSSLSHTKAPLFD